MIGYCRTAFLIIPQVLKQTSEIAEEMAEPQTTNKQAKGATTEKAPYERSDHESDAPKRLKKNHLQRMPATADDTIRPGHYIIN
jgi:hypothetical protein